jgi:TATA-box binding protein (TBP) (component of TFIID and TFIIIB)
MTDCDLEWESFCMGENNFRTNTIESISNNKNTKDDHSNENSNSNSKTTFDINIPKCSEIYISTRTKIGYFTKPIDINTLYWKISVIPYQQTTTGIIKKQIKITTTDPKYIEFIAEQLKKESMVEVHDLAKTNAKYVKKISIGLAKKDLISYRCKKKGAFYNCFVLIFRIKHKGRFKEMHVKIFNTGKIEIPGIKSNDLLDIIISDLLHLFKHTLKIDVDIKCHNFETVLINSNFNCGFYINREKLADILKYKYHLSTSYDPCSYPGIMSKFYYDQTIEEKKQTGVKAEHNTDPKTVSKTVSNTVSNTESNTESNTIVSFMIFRTGSILIVGKCSEPILQTVYRFIKNILQQEYREIFQNLPLSLPAETKKKKKIKRHFITIRGQCPLKPPS